MFERLREHKFPVRVISALILALLALFAAISLLAPPDKRSALLEELTAYRNQLYYPGTNIAMAANNLKNTNAVLKFVREDIALVHYADRRQTPQQVLKSRIANNFDKIVLLGALLEQLGWEISYVYENVQNPPLIPSQTKPKEIKSLKKTIRKIANLSGYNINQLAKEKQNSALALEELRAKIDKKVETTIDFIEEKTAYDDEYYTIYSSAPQIYDRILISATKNGTTRLFDPVFWDLGEPQAVYSFEMPELSLWQIELRLQDSSGLEQNLLNWEGEIYGQNVHLNFLPAIDSLQTLMGLPNPDKVPLWQPILRVNEKIISGKVFDINANAPTLADKPPISDPKSFKIADPQLAKNMELAQIDVSEWPLVRLGVNIDSDGEGSWISSHFSFQENEEIIFPRLLNIEQTSRPILILTDVSPSMEDIGAFEKSQKAIIKLLSMLADGTQVGLTSFAFEPIEEVAFEPLQNREEFIQAVNQLESRTYTGILAGLEYASNIEQLQNGIIVLLSDGEDNVGGNKERIIDKLKENNIKVFAIALGAEADAKLLQQIAKASDGQFAYLRTAQELEAFYARMGAEISSQIIFEYEAPELTSIAQEQEGNEENITINEQRNIKIALNGTKLHAKGKYLPPKKKPRTSPKLILYVSTKLNGKKISAKRILIKLDEPGAPMQLMSDYNFIGDLGGYPKTILAASYIDNIIALLRQKLNLEPEPVANLQKPDFDQMRLLNGFRLLSGINGKYGRVGFGVGPNIYLLRNELVRTKDNEYLKRTIFDVLLRTRRTANAGDANMMMRMEIASAIAEGLIIAGENGVDSILNDSEIIVRDIDEISKLSEEEIAPNLVEQLQSEKGEDDVVIIGKRGEYGEQWIWQVNLGWDLNFRSLFSDGKIIAKGASLSQLALQFDRIDKMYALYDAAFGNYGGLNPISSSMLSAIASFKREENKLWCYSTIMLGQLDEAIYDEDELLNRNPAAAKAKAARLCKMEGSGDNDDFLQRALQNAAADGANSFAINLTKETAINIGFGWLAGGHSAWSLGGALHDAATSYYRDIGTGFIDSSWSNTPTTPNIDTPMTPNFHRAIIDTILAD